MLRRHLFVYFSATSVYALLSRELAEAWSGKNTSNKRKIIVDADTNERRDVPRYDTWTLARVVKHRVEASPCFHSHSVLLELPFTHFSEV